MRAKAIAAYHRAQGAALDADHVILTAGTSEGYAHVFRLLANPGDRVHLPSPGYGLFDQLAALEGAEAVPYRLLPPTHGAHWLLDEADMAPAYRWHRRFLEHLQSGHMAERWLLKSPAHLWHLDALLAEYPDAVLIQTHRDPLKVIASVSALAASPRPRSSGTAACGTSTRRPPRTFCRRPSSRRRSTASACRSACG